MSLRSLSLFVAVGLSACSATEITHTQWMPSPTGEWLTRIERRDTSGPGAGDLNESVQLRRKGVDGPTTVLTISEQTGPASIKVKWLSPERLQLTITGGTIDFQAVRLSNVAIDTVQLPQR